MKLIIKKKIIITNNSSKMFIFLLPNLPFSRIATENRNYIMALCPQRSFLYFLKIWYLKVKVLGCPFSERNAMYNVFL